MNLELNTAERLTLQELSLHHRYADFRRRALGMLALAKGHLSHADKRLTVRNPKRTIGVRKEKRWPSHRLTALN